MQPWWAEEISFKNNTKIWLKPKLLNGSVFWTVLPKSVGFKTTLGPTGIYCMDKNIDFYYYYCMTWWYNLYFYVNYTFKINVATNICLIVVIFVGGGQNVRVVKPVIISHQRKQIEKEMCPVDPHDCVNKSIKSLKIEDILIFLAIKQC